MSSSAPSARPQYEWLPPLVLLIVGGVLFPAAGQDDKFITYWPAYTLAEWGEVLNYNGDRIEQSSSLLFVMLIAFVSKLTGLTPVAAGWGLGVGGGVLGVWATGRVAEQCQPGGGRTAALLVAVGAPYAYWSFGGMETPVVATCALATCLAVTRLAAAPSLMSRRALWALPILGYLLVRPESPIVVACILAGFIGLTIVQRLAPVPRTQVELEDHPAPLDWLRVAGVCALLAGAVLVFRLSYFESAFPQPVYAKSSSFELGTIKKGMAYLFREEAHWLLLPLAAMGAARVLLEALRGTATSLRTSIALFFVAYGSFIVLSGGGWMEATRFIGQMFPVVAILIVEAVRTLPKPNLQPVLAGVCIAVAFLGSVRVAQLHSLSMPLWAILQSDGLEDERYPWIVRYNVSNYRDIEMIDALGQTLAPLMKKQQEPVQVLAYNTGMVLYYTALQHYGSFGTVDLHGLSDRYVTHSRHNEEIRRFALGLRWSIGRYLDAQPEMHRDTLAPRPDVVLCAAWPKDARGVAWTSDYGFDLAYWQLRDFVSGTDFLPGAPVSASQVLAVRAEHRAEFVDFPAVVVPPAPPL